MSKLRLGEGKHVVQHHGNATGTRGGAVRGAALLVHVLPHFLHSLSIQSSRGIHRP